MGSTTDEQELSNKDEATSTRGSNADEGHSEQDKDAAFLKFTGLAILGLVFLGVLSTVFGDGTRIVDSTSENNSETPSQLALADDPNAIATPDWDLLGETTRETCRETDVTDSISYTGVADIWIRFNEQWITKPSGLEFSPFAEVVFEDGTPRTSDDVPEWLMSKDAKLTYWLDCYATVRSVDENSQPTGADSPSRIVASGDAPELDFG